MIPHISPQLREATNGVLMLVCLFACIGAAYYLVMCARSVGSLRQVYLEEKSAVSVAVTFGSLFAQFGALWWVLHVENHGHRIDTSWAGLQAGWHVGSTITAAIGVMCWLRVTWPESFPTWLWAIATGAAFAFGVLMAL